MVDPLSLGILTAILVEGGKLGLFRIAKGLNNKERSALQRAYHAALQVTKEEYASEYSEQEIKDIERDIQKLITEPNVQSLFIDAGLDKDFTADDRAELEKICEQKNIEFSRLLNFLESFLSNVKTELEVQAENEDYPLRFLVLQKAAHRIESNTESIKEDTSELNQKMDQLLAKLDDENNNEHLLELQKMVSDYFSEKLDLVRENWRAGKVDNIRDELLVLRTEDERWKQVNSEVKSAWLRTEAIILLETNGNVESAKELLQTAHELSPMLVEESYANAFVAYVEKDYDIALEYLKTANDEREIRLKTKIHIDMGEFDKAHATIELIDLPKTSLTYFTKAQLAIRQNNIQDAISDITNATRISPESEHMKFWLAQLMFFSIISPVERPTTFQSYLEPVSPLFIFDAPKHVKILHESAAIFKNLTESKNKDIAAVSQIWYLACLVNMPNKNDESLQYCELLLNEHRLSEIVVAWASLYQIQVNYQKIVLDLEEKIQGHEANHKHIIALASCYLYLKRFDDAVTVISDNKDLFVNELQTIWDNWIVQVSIAANQLDRAEKFLSNIKDTDRQKQLHFKTLVLRKNKNLIEEFLKADFSNNPRLVFDICHYMSGQDNWAWICRYSELLATKIGTTIALEIAVQGTFFEKEIEKCLEAINHAEQYYTPDKLPQGFRRIYTNCLLDKGDFVQALKEAQALYTEVPNGDSFLTLMITYQNLGDVQSITILARDLLDNIELVPVLILLQAIKLVNVVNHSLAVDLWRRAIQLELSDDDVLSAIVLANSLGTKSETAHLFHRFNALAQNQHPKVHIVEIDETVEIIRNQQDEGKNVIETYQKGIVPIQLATEVIRLPYVYHTLLLWNERTDNLSEQSALPARHGGRPIINHISKNQLLGCINLDVTSILLLEHFDLLDLLEENYAPLKLPNKLISGLAEMLLDLNQKDREAIEFCNEIVELANNDEITILPVTDLADSHAPHFEELGSDWSAQYHYVEQNEGYFVNFLPVYKRGLEFIPAQLPENASNIIIDIRAVVDALKENHILTQSQYNHVINTMGNLSVRRASIQLKPKRKLVFFDNTISVLSGYNLLGKVKELFEIVVMEEQLEDAKNVVSGDTFIHKQVAWLSQLIQRLYQGVLNGTYDILPMYFPANDEDTLTENLTANSIISLIEQCQTEKDVILVDDRYFNGVVQHHSAQILTSIDILRSLVEHKHIAEDDYYQYLLRFRRSNIRYIPYRRGEIIYNLVNSHTSLEIADSLHLRVMHNYISSCLTQDTIMQFAPAHNEPNQDGELYFIQITCSEIIYALFLLWEQRVPAFTEIASSWILEYLYLPNRAIFLKHNILKSYESNQPFPELFELGQNLSSVQLANEYSDQQLYKIWLWQWIEQNQTKIL